jgi:hypothetical protein
MLAIVLAGIGLGGLASSVLLKRIRESALPILLVIAVLFLVLLAPGWVLSRQAKGETYEQSYVSSHRAGWRRTAVA